MSEKRNLDADRRRDLEIIAGLVEENSRVLDLGCGDGLFLRRLKEEKKVSVLGVEIDQDSIVRCVGNGVPVIQGDLNDDLNYLPENSFDLAILSHTLQETRRPDKLLEQIVSIGKTAAVSVINFGHWRCRLQVAFKGKMPRSSQMPFQWYDTPNIHFCTLQDFRELCASLGIKIVAEYPVSGRYPRLTKQFPNLFAIGCVFVLSK
ncbi:MAG: methionine biosynthesis protein MetW [Lentisphaerae bacterium]|nr:methionine biosynthesis protein MetW [Lentisphaerota bacterium]MBQ4328640.1 methionine biosynthesis protein MetW [Lentisphaeria bacterium]MBR2720147.1 methionine biosynthesis protein MetW [Lentisphaeria bacterium]